MLRFKFSINLSYLYRHLGTEFDEAPEDLMSYDEFVEFVRNADVYVVNDRTGDYLVFEGEEGNLSSRPEGVRFPHGGKDMSDLEEIEERISEIEEELEDLKERIEEIEQTVKPVMKALIDSLLLSKICDGMVEKGLRLTKIGEYTADDGSKYDVILKLEERR